MVRREEGGETLLTERYTSSRPEPERVVGLMRTSRWGKGKGEGGAGAPPIATKARAQRRHRIASKAER